MEGNTTTLVKSEGSYGHFGKSSNVPMEKCLIAHQMLELPEQMNEDLSVFMSVMSADTWSNVLSESQRKHLTKFLPSFPENDKGEKSETLRQLFNGDNFKYGNPLKEFHKKLKGGRFSPDIAKYINLCRKAKQREYKCQQHVYYTNLLKEILINRQRILQAASLLPPEEPIVFEHFQLTDKTHKPKGIESRVKRRCAQMLSEINKECGMEDSSSSDDDVGESAMISRSRRQLFKVLRPGSPDNMDSGILGTFDPPPPPPMMPNGISGNGAVSQPKRSLSPVEMTENDLTEMLKKYKRRREKEPHHPELYIAGLSVDDIIMRVQAVKKFGRVVQRKKIRDRPQKRTQKMEVKTEVPVNQEDEEIDVSSTFDVVPDQSVMDVLPNMEKEADPEEWAQNSALPQMGGVECSPTRANFFSLIRDIIHEDPEQKVTTLRVEERVQEWQEMDGVMDNPWFLDQSNWVEQVASALKFLSGDVLGLSLENFVPLLDFKERAQHWKWIGMGRDSDAELEPLYHHWVQHKDDLSLDTSIKPCSSPPPPRSRTDFTVRPTTDEEKAFFREQERERFSNPHKAFTYRLHGYEAVVGPVKGVYHKENAMNKAREHTILVNDRPAYVTILTLVRDAAARLPNGEGTRSDICELLKDSQFLAPGVPDSQINTVVSGALDRLHYEKDPCVKYDVNRKLWIYLHRNRTQQEFERIHLAQGAAVKAKKALQKPKPAKKCKEAVASQSISMISPTVTMVTTTLPSQKLSSLADSKLMNVDTVTPAALTQSSVPVTKVTFTPSSPMAVPQSPLGTPQSSPRVIVSSPLVHGTPQPQSVSKLITASIRQVTPQVSQVIPTPQTISVTGALGTGEREVSMVTEPLTVTSFAGHTGSLSTSIGIQSPVTSGQQVTKLSGQNIVVGQPVAGQSMLPGQRPITLSLLQSQGSTKFESVTLAPGQTGKPRTVLLQTQGGKGPKILTHQVLRSSASQGVQVSGSPVRMAAITTSSQLTNLQAAISASQTIQLPISSSTQTLAAALARAGVVQTGATTLTKVGGGMVVGTSKPLLTRMVSGGQPQIVTLSSLWDSQANQQQKATEPKQMLKLQGGIIQSVSSSATTSTNVATIVNQSSTPATTVQGNVSAATKLQQVTVTRGGKPPTMVIGKLTGAGGRSLTSTTQTVAQIIQSGALVGKSAIVGGKPIIIGGKSLSFGGKPVQIGGKPVQLIGKGAHIGIVQSPGVVSTVNITQVSNIDTQASALVTQATAVTKAMSTVLSTKVSTDNPASSVVTMMTKSSHGSPMVSQLLKSAQQHAHNKPAQYITLPQGSEAQAKVTGQVQGQQIKIAGGQQQVVTLSGSGQKIVTLAQGVSGLTQVQQIGVSKSVSVGGTSKSIMIPAGAILQGNHFMLQQANLPSTTKVITPQQLLSGGGSRPTLITTGGIKGLQNIQLVKTVISQPGGKPGQTTILLAQPSSQAAVSVTTDTKVTQAGVKAKTPPVYARIITPPPGVRLAAVRPGQVLAGIQVAPVQGLNIAASQANVTNIQSAAASMPQVITQAASGTQDNSQSQISVEQAAAEKTISESNAS